MIMLTIGADADDDGGDALVFLPVNYSAHNQKKHNQPDTTARTFRD